MTKTIVFDVDGVMADFITPAVKKGYELAGRPEPTGWIQQGWDDYGGLTKDEISKLWEYIKSNPDFWYGLPLLATVRELTDIVRANCNGHNIYFATNRRLPGALDWTLAWLRKHTGMEFPCVVLTKRKGEFCRVVDADYYIDDKSENVDCAIWLTDGKTKAYVKDSVTNRGQYAPHSSKARRVSTIAEYLEDINNGV